MNRILRSIALLILFAPRLLSAQERGAVVLGEAVAGLDVTPRVLMIGAHPDDEDTQLLAWLARGRSRNRLPLADPRRRRPEPHRQRTRRHARHDPHRGAARRAAHRRRAPVLYARLRLRLFEDRRGDVQALAEGSILRDVVTVVRAFRPQSSSRSSPARRRRPWPPPGVRDPRARGIRRGRGHGALSGEDDARHRPVDPVKFYRASRFSPDEATRHVQCRRAEPLRGRPMRRSHRRAGRSISRRASARCERRGTSLDYLKLEVSRVGGTSETETSPLDGIATDWTRLPRASLPAGARARDRLAARRDRARCAPWRTSRRRRRWCTARACRRPRTARVMRAQCACGLTCRGAHGRPRGVARDARSRASTGAARGSGRARRSHRAA